MAKIYVDGKGLAMEKFILRVSSGSGWQNASKYEKDKKHRFKAQFRNYYSSGIPTGGSAYGSCGIHIADLTVHMKLPGAVFDWWEQDNGLWNLMPMQVGGHPDFNDTIAPAMARWFEFGTFTWKGPTTSASALVVQVYTHHREIFYMPVGPWANLVASSS